MNMNTLIMLWSFVMMAFFFTAIFYIYGWIKELMGLAHRFTLAHERMARSLDGKNPQQREGPSQVWLDTFKK